MSTKFPKIDIIKLVRMRDEAQIPAKKAKLPRAAGAWRLAKRMKEIEATQKLKRRMETAGIEVQKDDASQTMEWRNVVDYLTAAVAQGDFSVMDEFAAAWTAWHIKPDVVAADFPNGLTVHNGETVMNKKGRPVRVAVIEAIIRLQLKWDSPERAPSFKEIQAELVASISLDESELSRQLKALEIQGAIPSERDLKGAS